MPSPIGHAIAGAALARGLAPRRATLLAVGIALALAADLDLVAPGTHRMATHSVGAVAAIFIVAILVTDKVTALLCATAYASHLLLDWLGADPVPPHGVQLLWPLSDGWYISGLNLFRGTARRDILSAASIWTNATAIAQEIAILGPIAWLVWRARR